MRAFKLLLVVGVLVFAIGSSAFAGGSNVYPNGAEGFWMGAAPPPGFYYVNYDLWYTSHKYTDNNSNELTAGPLGPFRIDALAQVSRFIYISDKQILGANWGSHLFLIAQDVKITSAAGGSHASGLGDVIIDPFILAWHSPKFHVTTGVDIYLPTGDYQAGRLANLSANAVVFEPVFAFTYMTPKEGLTTSFKFMYDIPTKNNDFTHPFNPALTGALKPGQEFHFDYSVDYMFSPEWKAGIGGYYYQQMTDDQLNGVDIKNSKGRVVAVGPGVEYSKGRVFASLRTQFEMAAKNRQEGIATWLRVVYVF